MSIYQLADNVSMTELDGEAVLLNVDSGTYYGLNHIGVHLLNGLQDGRSVTRISADIALQYQVDAYQVQTDLNELLNQLIQQQLLSCA